MAQPEAQARALMPRNGDGSALVRKTIEDATPAPAEPETDWSHWQAWLDGHLANEREAILNIVTEGVNEMLDHERIAFERDLATWPRAHHAEDSYFFGAGFRALYGVAVKLDSRSVNS